MNSVVCGVRPTKPKTLSAQQRRRLAVKTRRQALRANARPVSEEREEARRPAAAPTVATRRALFSP